MLKRNHLYFLLIILSFSSCNIDNKRIAPALNSITAEDMKKQISVIASDDFLGRAPSTTGEEKTINYLAGQFKQLGLVPANNGSYFQEVSLLKLTADKSMKLDIIGAKSKVSLLSSGDFIGSTPQVTDLVSIDNSDIVFVGYGINSPEYNWNDYAGTNVKGKTVLMLVNDLVMPLPTPRFLTEGQ